MSGCANCVWIQYADELQTKLRDGSDVARSIIMKEVQDTNMRSFLEMELRMIAMREKKWWTNSLNSISIRSQIVDCDFEYEIII